jgi:hypothetical protein
LLTIYWSLLVGLGVNTTGRLTRSTVQRLSDDTGGLDGVLTVEVAKASTEKPRRIKIQ